MATLTQQSARILAERAQPATSKSHPFPPHQDRLNPDPDGLDLPDQDRDNYILDMAFGKPIQARLYPLALTDNGWRPGSEMVNMIHFGEKLMAVVAAVSRSRHDELAERMEQAGATLPEGCTWGTEDPSILVDGADPNAQYPATLYKRSRRFMVAITVATMAEELAALYSAGKLARDIPDTTPASQIVNATYTSTSARVAKKSRGR